MNIVCSETHETDDYRYMWPKFVNPGNPSEVRQRLGGPVHCGDYVLQKHTHRPMLHCPECGLDFNANDVYADRAAVLNRGKGI